MQIKSNNPNFDSGPNIGGWSSAEAQQGVILASAMLLAIPIVSLYLFFQRYIIESMVSSGIKG